MSDGELEGEPAAALQQALDVIRSGKISLVINIPEGSSKAGVVSNGYQIRRCTCDHGVSLITNVKVAKLFVEAMAVRSNIVSFPLIALLPRCALSLSVCLPLGLLAAGLLMQRREGAPKTVVKDIQEFYELGMPTIEGSSGMNMYL